MSLHVNPEMSLAGIPDETVRAAHAAFPKGNVYLRLRDELGGLFALGGQWAESPARLAVVTLMPFMEHLTDRQAADAVRARIDWKYLLGLPWSDAGFDFSLLSTLRARLIAGHTEGLLLERLLSICQTRGWLKARGRQRSDSTHVLGALAHLNRLEMVAETVRHALNVLATVAPQWLQTWVPSDWWARYPQRIDDQRLPKDPPGREQLALTFGREGGTLLAQVEAPSAPTWLRHIEAGVTLRQVWAQQYDPDQQEGQWRWRRPEELPPGQERIVSPYDPEARCGGKRALTWDGYPGWLPGMATRCI